MAVKAKAEITLSHMIDVVGTYRYYMLVSTTANAPNRPSAADYPPPALLQNTNWTTVEPSYEEGSTSSLYFVDCSVYSNGTCYYSEVSLSSSYEFSKAAYEKAVNAGITANDAHKKAEDAEKIANAGAKKIFTHVRNFTRANWQTYGAAGHSKSWTTGASYDNTHIHVGDIAYIAGTVSDAGGSNTVSAMIYGTVTAVTTSAVVMTSLYYIMGGEGGAYAKASAAQAYAENLSQTIEDELEAINVKFNDKVGFTDVDGSKTATIIDGGVIKTNTINANRIITSTLTALGAVTAGSFNLGNGKFKVASDGTLTCTGATITGDITATSFIVMDGDTQVASFGANDIYLGNTAAKATIHLCGDIGQIIAEDSSYDEFFDKMVIDTGDLLFRGQYYRFDSSTQYGAIENGTTQSYSDSTHASLEIDSHCDYAHPTNGIGSVSARVVNEKADFEAAFNVIANGTENPYIRMYASDVSGYAEAIFSPTGLTISKALAVSGSISEGGTALSSKYVPLSGGAMTGQLLTSFKSSVAMGSYGSSVTTIPNLVAEIRYSSGAMGSVNISTAYTSGSITIAAGWYNFIYSPHRSGGANGAASGDNHNYGTLLLTGMTVNNANYRIRVANGSIAEVARVLDSSYTGAITVGNINASNEYLSGSLYVGGKSSTTDGKTGVAFGARGNICMQGASAPALKFYKGTATTSSTDITVDGNSNLLFNVPSMSLLLYSSAMRTSTDNSCYLGAGSYRWKAVYAGTGAIQTSDLNQKKDLVKLLDDERYIKLFDLVEPYAYTFTTGDRRHTGFISQYVEEALKIAGLTAEDCGFFCKDIKTAPVYDEDGTYMGEKDVCDENGNPTYVYSLRYEEYIAIIGAKLKKLESEVMKKLAELENKLN